MDTVGLESRAADLAGRALGDDERRLALELAVGLVELTALGADETRASLLQVCASAVRPDHDDPSLPSVAAVCVRPALVAACRELLAGSDVRVASDSPAALDEGADEVLVPLDSGAFLAGRHAAVLEQIAHTRALARAATLKVLLDPAPLGTYEALRRAALLAIAAGADVLAVPGATPAAALCVLQAIGDAHGETGRAVGFQASVGTGDEALGLLVLVHETLGPDWLAPARCRLAGRALLRRLLLELRSERTGLGQSADALSLC